jgi:uncharacterized protein YjbI with pentapeptide repeats
MRSALASILRQERVASISRGQAQALAQVLKSQDRDQVKQAIEIIQALEGSFLLQGWDLSREDLTFMYLRGATLKGCSFRSAYMEGVALFRVVAENCNFEAAMLAESNLSRGVFKGCSFRGAEVIDLSVRKATFDRCDFNKADLRDAHFRDCTFRDCTFEGILTNESTVLPEELW